MSLPETGPAVDLACLVRLNATLHLGLRQYRDLVGRFGSPRAIFEQGRSALREVQGIGEQTAAALLAPQGEEEAAQEIARAGKEGYSLIPFSDPRYPELLGAIHNPPLLLYVWGDPAALASPLPFGVVGTRHPSIYGKMQAARFARELSSLGFCVVSGLARGIDGSAHEGALSAGGKTVAFLGCGVNRPYPPDHRKLAEKIAAKGGAVASEFPLDTKPVPQNFPRRNRLISGASLGVLVIEAAERSGALITTSHATEQGRDVFALPGRVDSPNSRGTHKLIRDGAKLVEAVEDIVEELSEEARGILRSARKETQPKSGESQEGQEILKLLSEGELHIDELILASGLASERVSSILTALELSGQVRRFPGMVFTKTPCAW